MQSKTSFATLLKSSLVEIITYLDIKDVLFTLNLTCRKIHCEIIESPYITRSLFQKLIGRKMLPEWQLTNERLKNILKAHFKTYEPPINLPYFGFQGNSGCDQDQHQFLFDKIFEHRETHDPVCTRVGTNFDIQGVLSADFKKETHKVQQLLACLQGENAFVFQAMKKSVETFGVRMLGFPNIATLQLQDITTNRQEALEIMKSIKEDYENFQAYIASIHNKYNIRLPCKELPPALGLIQSCNIHRGLASVTCPVKTLMAFAYSSEINQEHPLVSLFNGCKTSQDLTELIKQHRKALPGINRTSIGSLSYGALKYQEEELVDYVVFNSNGMKEDVIPLFWITFNEKETRKFSLDLKGSRFSGKYVVVKLISCENMMGELGGNHETTNIDIQYCSFNGHLLYL